MARRPGILSKERLIHMYQRFSRAAVVAGLCVLAVTVIGCGHRFGWGVAHSTSATASKPTTPPVTQVHFQVGQQATIGDTWVVTVNSVAASPGNATDKPKAGTTFVVIDVSLRNISSQPQQVSSLLEFRLADSTGALYTEMVTSFGAPPNGTVNSAGATRGRLVFETPVTQHDFVFSFEPQLANAVKALWDVTV